MDESTRVLNTTPNAAGELVAGARIGAWRIMRVIGRGGMGEVYLAERADENFDKQVAIKLVQGAMTPAAQLRFDGEKQALARLEHPHIARLIDAGETERGWPYLVMEYVDGMPIDDYLADKGVDDVLAIFLQVCDAAAYAHRQLVLHRDIKPNNILVDGDGDAKLLDFGIAKLLQSAEGSEISQTVERAYTPEYASPEQVFGRPIGVASDVYSLGVLFYRLLTGMSPYRFDAGDTAALVHALTDETLVAPSRAILGGDTQHADSTRRRRSRLLAGDLDTIVRTALNKQPERRYASVDAFAEDIRRHIAHEPIRAQPDSLRYRAGKFLRRNVFGVAATVALSVALIGGLVASLWQAHIADQQRQHAEQRFDDVRTLAHAMLYDLNDELKKLPGSTSARKLLVQEAMLYLQKLSAEDDTSLPMRRELAGAWMHVGDVQGGGVGNIGDVKGALASFAQARKQIEAVVKAAPNDFKAKRLHASILMHQGNAMYQSNALVDAERTYRQGLAEWTELAKHDPQDEIAVSEAQEGLGEVMYWTSRLDKALAYYQQAQGTLIHAGPGKDPRKYELLMSKIEQNSGYTQGWLNHPQLARSLLQQSISRLQKWLETHPDDIGATRMLANSWLDLGDNMYDLPDKQPMVEAYTKYHDAAAQWVAHDPVDVIARRQLALGDQKIGDAHFAMHQYGLALVSYDKAREAEEAISAHDASDENARMDLANSWYEIGATQGEMGHRAEAVAAYRQTLALRQAFVKQDPNAAMELRDLAVVEGDLADVLSDHAEACRYYLASDALWQQLAHQGQAPPSDHEAVERVHGQAAACR